MIKDFLIPFIAVSIAELGDKTQISAALFAAEFNPIWVFFGVMLALALISLTTIYLGSIITKRMDKKVISIIAGIIFILSGIAGFFF